MTNDDDDGWLITNDDDDDDDDDDYNSDFDDDDMKIMTIKLSHFNNLRPAYNKYYISLLINL